MKITLPISKDNGLESTLSKNFGSAKYFVIIYSKKGNLKTLKNQKSNHKHGNCHPLVALGSIDVDVIVTITIGNKALLELHSAGIKVFKAIEGNINQNYKETY